MSVALATKEVGHFDARGWVLGLTMILVTYRTVLHQAHRITASKASLSVTFIAKTITWSIAAKEGRGASNNCVGSCSFANGLQQYLHGRCWSVRNIPRHPGTESSGVIHDDGLYGLVTMLKSKHCFLHDSGYRSTNWEKANELNVVVHTR